MRGPNTLRITGRRHDDSARHNSISSQPSCESFNSISSDGSIPITPTFSARGHARHSSSNSSLSSTPPAYEHADASKSTGALPDPKKQLPLLEEHPMEKEEETEAEDDYVIFDSDTISPCLCDDRNCAHQAVSGDSLDGYFPDVGNPSAAKRRRSGEPQGGNIAARAHNRISSLSRRLTDRRSKGTISAPTTSCSTPVRGPSSRSSSMSAPVAPVLELTLETQLAFSSPRPSVDVAASSPIDIAAREKSEDAINGTPLLPPMMIATRANDDTPLQSPLQSPTVATSPVWDASVDCTPVVTPQVTRHPSLRLSPKASVTSLQVSRPSYLVSSAEIPPMMIADPTDEWAIKLGHANFTIYPEPYLPEVCDNITCRKLFSDWDEARRNFIRHQVRTGEHFGVTSKTYALTEQKWAEIDAQWKKNNDLAVTQAAEKCDSPVTITPTEPAPLIRMPSLNDPKSEGKFPKLGDEDIVGPMVQIASQIQQRPSRRTTFLKLLGGTFRRSSSSPVSPGNRW